MNKSWLRRLLLSFLPGELNCCFYCGKQLSRKESDLGRTWCCYKHKDLIALRKRNKERKRFNDRKYKNSLKGKESAKRFKDSPKGRRQIRWSGFIRAARKNSVIHAFTKKEWGDLLKSTNGICPGCNRYVGIKNLTLDHIIPLADAKKNQIYTIKDIQSLCVRCNSSKGAKR
jgi:5-methylcytosine-specific restriction endonuclease McrA